MFHFYPYLYDSRSAWESAISDSRFSYSMNLSSFMKIYAEYRDNHNKETHHINQFTNELVFPKLEPQKTKPVESDSVGKILSQEEIDELIKNFH